MPTSINHPSHAKGKRSLPLLLALIGITVMSFLVYAPPSKSALLNDLTSRLRDEKFEQLYDEASDNLRLNVTRERFVRRMKAATAKLKAVDPALKFRNDPAMESLFAEADGPYLLTSALKLEGNGKSVYVSFSWNPKGEFLDLSVTPSHGTSEEFHVYGVLYNRLNIGGRIVED